MNTLFDNACKRIDQKTPPIWYMRQAGRYHSHYRNLKKTYTFEQLCKIPDMAAEVACGPVMEFDLDVAILFSDILYVLEGLGLPLKFDPGPKFGDTVTKDNIDKYSDVDRAVEHMQFQYDCIQATRAKLRSCTSLIGFVGGPWTVLRYAIDNSVEPAIFTPYLKNVIIPLLKRNIQLQLDAGAEKVMIFDSGISNMNLYYHEHHYVPMLKELAGPNVGYYAKGKEIDLVKDLGWAGIGVDSSQNLPVTFNKFLTGFVQGNFDEQALLLPTKDFKRKLEEFCNELLMVDKQGWVCGLGHGIHKDTPEEHVHIFVNEIRKRFS